MTATTTRTAGRYVRQVPEDVLVDVVARRVIGESIRTISTATGVPRSTVADLLKAPDIAEMVKSEKAIEHRRAGDRERQARKTVRDTRAKHGVAADANPQTPVHERRTIGEQRRSGSQADGKVLGVVIGGLDAQGRAPEVIIFGRDVGDESEEQWLARRKREREEAIGLPSSANATVQTPTGRYSYDPFDLEDIARIVQLVEDDFRSIDANDLRATLASVQPGRTFTLDTETAAEAV